MRAPRIGRWFRMSLSSESRRSCSSRISRKMKYTRVLVLSRGFHLSKVPNGMTFTPGCADGRSLACAMTAASKIDWTRDVAAWIVRCSSWRQVTRQRVHWGKKNCIKPSARPNSMLVPTAYPLRCMGPASPRACGSWPLPKRRQPLVEVSTWLKGSTLWLKTWSAWVVCGRVYEQAW